MLSSYYPAIKSAHVGLAALSFLFYLWRGGMLLANSPNLDSAWARILPHIFYTLLIAAGATLATLGELWGQGWIWLKITLLVGFVVLGAIAFRRHSQLPRGRRAILWFVGLCLFGFIFAVAGYHHAQVNAPEAAAASAIALATAA